LLLLFFKIPRDSVALKLRSSGSVTSKNPMPSHAIEQHPCYVWLGGCMLPCALLEEAKRKLVEDLQEKIIEQRGFSSQDLEKQIKTKKKELRTKKDESLGIPVQVGLFLVLYPFATIADANRMSGSLVCAACSWLSCLLLFLLSG
jgi:hypothetical protein